VGLLLYKSVPHVRVIKSLQARDGSAQASILTVMMQDGVGYSVLNTAITIATFLVNELASPNLRHFLYNTQASVQNVLCCMLLFHLYKMYDSPVGMYMTHVNPDTTVEMRPIAFKHDRGTNIDTQ